MSVADEERKFLTIYGVRSAAEGIEENLQKQGMEHLAKEIRAVFK